MADVNAILTMLRSELGKPYVWGADGPNTFDCSGLVQYVYGQNGISLPRTSAAQSTVGTRVPTGQEQPGDLVFSDWEGKGTVSHVAVYVGNGQVIEAPEPGEDVHEVPLNANYLSHVINIQRVGNITGSAGANVSGTATSSTGDAFSGITGAISDLAKPFTEMSALATSLNKLAMPEWWVRIVAGIAGTFLVFFGLWKLTKEVRD